MNIALIFAWIWLAMIANGFWEAYAEGRNCWDKGKLGWKIRIGKRIFLTAYHFFLFCVMWPLMLTLPLVIYGWDTKVFGVLLSAYISGQIIEDFTWFVVNPKVKLKEFGPKFANYYPWIIMGKFKVPLLYVIGIALAMASWYFLWR